LKYLVLVLALAGLGFLTAYPALIGRSTGLPYIAIGSALVGLGGIVFMSMILFRLIAWRKNRRLSNRNWGREEKRD
jgi:uncharacterized integral membrane protein